MVKCDECKWYRGPEYAVCHKDRFVGDRLSLCRMFEEKDRWKRPDTVSFEPPSWTEGVMDALLYGKWNKNNPYIRKEYNKMFNRDKVKKVIFNPPATIVYWFDGTKTVVKAQGGDIFDKEKGFAMACAKKFFGNRGNYYNEFRKHGANWRPIVKESDFNLDRVVPKSILEDVCIDIEEGLTVGFDKVKAIDRKFEEFSKLEEYATKSKAIVNRIKEGLNAYWGLKLYVDPETKPDILDTVIFNDSGKSLRFVCDLDEVELEKIDDSVKTIMKNVSERCL